MPGTTIAPRRMLEVGDLARASGVSVQTVRRWASQGLIPPPILTGTGRRLWDGEVLQEIQRLCEERQAARVAGHDPQAA